MEINKSHYEMPIDPIEFALSNGLGFCEGNVVKYICRYEKKNGKEDLLKAIDYIQRIIAKKYGD